ncbi:MAG: type II 3-dehydroquinate dehydratase [Bacteroidota bacterium]
MTNILILNGPNLNLLGKREPDVYGSLSFEEYFQQLQLDFPSLQLTYFQSNSEGAIIDKLQEVGFHYDGILLNAGAYTHTSIAIADAIRAIETPVIEIHISNVYARESFRHHSHLSAACRGCIIGFGLKGYALGLQALMA